MATTSNSDASKPERMPMLLLRAARNEEIAIRFWNIGARQQFILLLQRFRSEFILARPEKIDGLDWLVLMQSQTAEVMNSARRYGLRVVEEA